MLVVISGLPGAGSSSVAALLSQKLNLPSFIAGRLFKDIALGTLQNQTYYALFKQLCEKKRIVLPNLKARNDEEAAHAIWATIGKTSAFHAAIDELQKKLSEKGNMVIEGKLSVHIIPRADLKVWLTASPRARAERQAKKNKISLQDATRLLEQRQEQERVEWKRIYNIDYLDQEFEANIVIDTTEKEQPEVVQIILNHLKHKL